MGKVILPEREPEIYVKEIKKSQCRHTGREKTSVMIITLSITEGRSNYFT
jgi:hypothetical protein